MFKAVQEIVRTSEPINQFNQKERTRGRNERRLVSLYLPTKAISQDWPKLNRVIYVERIFSSRNGYHHTESFYISSLLSNNAKLFATGIRGHWSIENNLHWVKDVILKEDTTKHKKGYSAKNMSILRNIAINVFRENNYSSTKHATLFFASNVKELLKIIFRT